MKITGFLFLLASVLLGSVSADPSPCEFPKQWQAAVTYSDATYTSTETVDRTKGDQELNENSDGTVTYLQDLGTGNDNFFFQKRKDGKCVQRAWESSGKTYFGVPKNAKYSGEDTVDGQSVNVFDAVPWQSSAFVDKYYVRKNDCMPLRMQRTDGSRVLSTLDRTNVVIPYPDASVFNKDNYAKGCDGEIEVQGGAKPAPSQRPSQQPGQYYPPQQPASPWAPIPPQRTPGQFVREQPWLMPQF